MRNPGGVADQNDDEYVANYIPDRIPFRDPYAWARIRARTDRFGRGNLVARYRGRGRGSGTRGNKRGNNTRGRGGGRGRF